MLNPKCGEVWGGILSIASMWDRVGQSAESSVQTGLVVEWLHVPKMLKNNSYVKIFCFLTGVISEGISPHVPIFPTNISNCQVNGKR